MPTYQYRCLDCANEHEAVQKFTEDALTDCPECDGTLRKVYSAVGVVFKGSGFYATDNRSKGSAKAIAGSDAKNGGSEAVAAFAQRRAEELERRYLPLLATETDPRRKAEVLANAMSDDGFVASVTDASGSATALQICQHNCPVAHVAGEFPELCTAETEAMARLLGTNVTRLATIAHGDGVCTAVVSVPDTARSDERIPS